MSGRPAIVVMGVSAAGKTSVGRALAARLGLDFVDGDTLHPSANIEKMARGMPLDDADRATWFDAVGHVLADERTHPAGVVVACSALKRSYRDRLRSTASGCRFLYLSLPCAVAAQRLAARKGHFMPASLLADQYATLEEPEGDERDIIALDAALPLDDVITQAAATIRI